MNIQQFLERELTKDLVKISGKNFPAIVKPAQRTEFGHYQANGIMGAAKALKQNPRELAKKLVSNTQARPFETEIAGPGFINITLKTDFIADALSALRSDPLLGITKPKSLKIVVDYSSPNLAKEMHIGHLRTTTIGDSIVRILEYIGHDLVRANHVGDWGAQFGSLLAYMDQLTETGQSLSTELKDLERFYQAASALFKKNQDFAEKARNYVVKLQSGDPNCIELWKQFISESIRHSQVVYKTFDITLANSDIRAESAYNDDLPTVVQELASEHSLLVESDGAKCVFLDEFKGKDQKPLPAIIQKSDGGYPYMATDLAAARYRTRVLKANKVLYVVGVEQQLHLKQVFAVAKKAGYIQKDQEYKHLSFGMVLKEDGSRFKTRDGADVKLIDVVNEAIERALALVSKKNPSLSISEKQKIARVVGIGSIKYAELSKNRTTDYIFDWDRMLSFEGNTAPYLQYSYTRIRSLFRRAEINSLEGKIEITEEAEIRLSLKILQFPEAIESTLEDYQANVLCGYLYELSGLFNTFYERCPILGSYNQTSRLILCDLTSRIIKQGLELLGIKTVEQM
ncbi:MAG: arginine--tRNA ligase [Candidatus Azotimanducaceae bacterium]|uniref:Arginine--tRNA ligase n=1 Tax=OM182 bacterium TaxID=2510334 RepID=A0A520S3Q3_9GAMM|nr:arginine--tRNA ligase [Gammaproteobacteria bacterium]OUV67618.1 MAG: arginine--tRNA ligase [Gammaproteobacteria bacterium TMED133]RZO77084.1 MAG: arginine--tRNA ligase [OM182 bacterium]